MAARKPKRKSWSMLVTSLGGFMGNFAELVVLLARILLAVVFGIAGIGKLLDLKGSRTALVAFGLPARLATPMGTALPFVELAVCRAFGCAAPSAPIHHMVGFVRCIHPSTHI